MATQQVFPAFRFPVSGFRFSLLPLVAVACFLQLAPSAKAQPPLTSPGLDGIDCITAYDADDAPLQVCENSSDPWNDLDEISLPSNDRATIPSRDDHAFSSFCLLTSSFSLAPRLSACHSLSSTDFFHLPSYLLLSSAERAPPCLV
jgi:hypothetical protein